MKRYKSTVIATYVICMTFLPGAAVRAGTVLFVDADAPGPVHDGSSWATAFTDLQDALDQPEASGGLSRRLVFDRIPLGAVADGRWRGQRFVIR